MLESLCEPENISAENLLYLFIQSWFLGIYVERRYCHGDAVPVTVPHLEVYLPLRTKSGYTDQGSSRQSPKSEQGDVEHRGSDFDWWEIIYFRFA